MKNCPEEVLPLNQELPLQETAFIVPNLGLPKTFSQFSSSDHSDSGTSEHAAVWNRENDYTKVKKKEELGSHVQLCPSGGRFCLGIPELKERPSLSMLPGA